MNRIFLYAMTLAGSGVLTYLSGLWFGAEWHFGLLTIGLYALFLRGWKSLGHSGGGLIIVTVFILISLDSILFVQNIAAFICSLVMGLLLIPHFKKQKDGVMASMVFVFLNLLICIDFVMNEMLLWLFAVTTGAAALAGFYYRFNLLKICYMLLFLISSFFLLLFEFTGDVSVHSGLAILMIALFIVGMYRMNQQVSA